MAVILFHIKVRSRKIFSYAYISNIMSVNAFKIPHLVEIDPGVDDNYFQLVENLPAAIYTCDEDGYIKFYNKAAAILWGREPELGTDLWCGSWKIYHLDGSFMPLDECP